MIIFKLFLFLVLVNIILFLGYGFFKLVPVMLGKVFDRVEREAIELIDFAETRINKRRF